MIPLCRDIRRKPRKKIGYRFDIRILDRGKFSKPLISILSVLFLKDADLVSNPINNVIVKKETMG